MTKIEQIDLDKIDLEPTDYDIAFHEALHRAVRGYPPIPADLAPRGDRVRIRRIDGRIEQVRLLDWHMRQRDRHLLIYQDDPTQCRRQHARFMAISVDRISYADEIKYFVMQRPTAH